MKKPSTKNNIHNIGQRSKGFTLLELLVVMVIIGLLAAYVGPRYFAQIGKSEQGAAKAQIEALAKALDTYRLDTGSYPSADKGLNALMAKPADEPKWRGPYLQKSVPLDPWGKPYVYKPPSAGSDFDFALLRQGRPARRRRGKRGRVLPLTAPPASKASGFSPCASLLQLEEARSGMRCRAWQPLPGNKALCAPHPVGIIQSKKIEFE